MSSQSCKLVDSWVFFHRCNSPKSWSCSSCAVPKCWSPPTPFCLSLYIHLLPDSGPLLYLQQGTSQKFPKWRCFSGFPLWPGSWEWGCLRLCGFCHILLPQSVSTPWLSIDQVHWLYGSYSLTGIPPYQGPLVLFS